MDKTVTVTEVSGYTKDWTSQYGTFTTHYCKVNDFVGVVEVNKKQGNAGPKVGDQLTGTFTKSEFIDKAGNEHYKFKAAPKAFGGSSVDLSPVLAKLDEILALVKKLNTDALRVSQAASSVAKQVDEVFDVSDEPINIDDIPF